MRSSVKKTCRSWLVLASTVSALALTGVPQAMADSSGAAPTEVLAGDVFSAPATVASVPTAPDRVLQVGITMQNPNAGAQDALYQAMYTPGNAQYHQFLTADEVASEFGLPSTTYSQVLTWATRDGLQLVFSPDTHEYLLLTGTAAQVEQTFNTALRDFSVEGNSFYANTVPPTVPAGLDIAGVIGLNNLLKSRTFHQAPPASAPHGTPAQDTCVSTTCIGFTTPQDLWSIYGQPKNLADTTQNFGQGQQMAVLGEGAVSGPLSDLRAFEKEFSLPRVPVTIQSVGDDFQDTSGSGEWDIDTQASTGMAPKAYGETLIFAKDLTDSSTLADFSAFETNRHGPLQANASFGECEQDPTSPVTQGGAGTSLGGLAGTAGIMYTQEAENVLQQATLQGKTLFSSTGDTGSSCPVVFAAVIGAGNGVANQGYPETNYPASSRYVVAVGGTVLYGTANTATPPASNSTRSMETAWTFTGGGNTFYIPEPAYQKGIALLDNQPCISQPDGTPYASPTPCRGIPDVSAQSGDVVSNGYAVTMGGQADSQGAGTSLSSPLWMGMWTRIQAATLKPHKGVFTQGFADPTFYHVASNPTQDAASFFDVGGGPPTRRAIPSSARPRMSRRRHHRTAASPVSLPAPWDRRAAARRCGPTLPTRRATPWGTPTRNSRC